MILAREIREFERHKNLEKLIETESPLMVAFKEAFQITDSLRNKQSREQYLEHTKYYLKMYFDDIFYRSRYHEYIIDNLVPENTKTVEDITFLQKRHVENGYIVKDISFTHDGRDYNFQERVKAFSLSDFEALFF